MSIISPPILYVVNDPLNADKEIQLNLNAISFGEGLTTAPIGISLGVIGFTTSVAGIPTTTNWTTVNGTCEKADALLPNLGFNNHLVVGDTLRCKSVPVGVSTRECEMSAGDDAVVGEHFGIDWTGAGQPFIMNTLDATDLQILDTTLQLEQTTGTPQIIDITATSVSIVGGNNATWASIIAGGGGNPTITQVLTAGNNALDKTQLFSHSLTTLTTTITDSSIIITDSATGNNSILENNILMITDNTGGINSVATLDLTGCHQTTADPLGYNSLMNATYQNIVVERLDNATGITETAVADFINGVSYSTANNVNDTMLSMKTNLTAGTIKCYNSLTSSLAPIEIQTSAFTVNGSPVATAQNIAQVLATGNNASGQNITSVGDIGLSTINGSSYPPSYATPDLFAVLSAGNSAGSQNIISVNDITLNTINGSAYPPYPVAPYGLYDTLNYNNDAGGLSMTNVNNIDLSSINGSPYSPPSPQDLSTTLSLGNSAGSSNINMNSQNIENANDIQLVSVNGTPYIQAKFSAVFPTFNIGFVSNNTTAYGGSGVAIPIGNYQITYTLQLDGNISQGGGQDLMVRGYCFIFGSQVGSFNPDMVSQGFMPSQVISYGTGAGYYNCLTATDYISVSSTDTFQLGVYQENQQFQNASNCFISAVLQSV